MQCVAVFSPVWFVCLGSLSLGLSVPECLIGGVGWLTLIIEYVASVCGSFVLITINTRTIDGVGSLTLFI